tara:strand:- start:3043 stop:3375 length:333 start_codon:yes stop_codon:yes gene_type:complete
MRVNLSYSVELEEVPDKVLDLLNEANMKMNHLAGKFMEFRLLMGTHDPNREPDIYSMITCIDEIRQEMAKQDIRLEECAGILTGFLNVKLGNIQEKSTEEQEVLDNEDNL